MVETRDAKKRRTNGEEDCSSSNGAAAGGGHTPHGSSNDDIMKMVISMQQTIKSMKSSMKKTEARCNKLQEENDNINDKLHELTEDNKYIESRLEKAEDENYKLHDLLSEMKSADWSRDYTIKNIKRNLQHFAEEKAKEVHKLGSRMWKVELECKLNKQLTEYLQVRFEDKIEQHEMELVEHKAEYTTSSYAMELDIGSVKTSLSCVTGTIAMIKHALAHNRSLGDNGRWDSPVPRTRSSDWFSMGYNELTTNIMQALVARIRDLTRDMRVDGGSDGQIVLNFDDLPFPIHYNDIMFPQWEEFAKALDIYRSFVVHENLFDIKPLLEISNICLPKQVLDLLEGALIANHIDRVTLCRNNGGRDIVSFASNVMKNNCKLKELQLIDNPIHEDDFSSLVDEASDHAFLNNISLEGSCRGLSYETVTLLFSQCTNLRTINLSHNNITTSGNTFLSDFLQSNTSLCFLELEGNNLNNEDAISIARALKTHNSTLLYIRLDNNDITHEGQQALLGAVFDSSSLNAASDSNHVCLIHCDDDWLRQFNRSTNRSFHRRQKLYHILSTRNRESSIVEQFDEDLAREHMPTLLNSIQRYSVFEDGIIDESLGAVPPLSITYELLRGWNMPSLYERSTYTP